jgi:hypothetical protein
LPLGSPTWNMPGQNDAPLFGYEFYFKSNNNTNEIVFLSRTMTVILSIILGIYVFLWSKELFGTVGGILSLFLYSFSPEIIAHSSLTTTDLGFALFSFLSLYYFWKFVQHINVKNFLLVSIFFGLAQLAKYTAVFLIPIFFVIIVFIAFGCSSVSIKSPMKGLNGTRTLHKFYSLMIYFFLILLIAGLIINLQFGFKGLLKPINTSFQADQFHAEYRDITQFVLTKNTAVKQLAGILVNRVPMPLAYPYLRGLGTMLWYAKLDHTTFAAGNYSNQGFWYYYILAFFVKTPIPLMLLFLASLFFLLRRKHLFDLYFLGIPIILFVVIMSFSNAQIGIRHILQIYPFIFVMTGSLTTIRFRNHRLLPIFYLLLLWYFIGTIAVAPQELSYFNEFAWQNGYKYFADSSIEYGQSLKWLSDYLKENNIPRIQLSYYGSVDPGYYRINYSYLPSSIPSYLKNNVTEDCSKRTGYIAVSVNTLQGLGLRNRYCYSWLKQYKPEERIGSIFLYNIQ